MQSTQNKKNAEIRQLKAGVLFKKTRFLADSALDQDGTVFF